MKYIFHESWHWRALHCMEWTSWWRNCFCRKSIDYLKVPSSQIFDQRWLIYFIVMFVCVHVLQYLKSLTSYQIQSLFPASPRFSIFQMTPKRPLRCCEVYNTSHWVNRNPRISFIEYWNTWGTAFSRIRRIDWSIEVDELYLFGTDRYQYLFIFNGTQLSSFL